MAAFPAPNRNRVTSNVEWLMAKPVATVKADHQRTIRASTRRELRDADAVEIDNCGKGNGEGDEFVANACGRHQQHTDVPCRRERR